MATSSFRARVFELEAQAVRAREDADLARYAAIFDELNGVAMAAGIVPVDHGLAFRAVKAWLDEATMSVIAAARVHIGASQQPIDDAAIEVARTFVADLVGVDLSSVRVVRSAGVGTEEASALACDTRDHIILLPPTGFKSIDLLVHEFGHTAEFLVRRSADEDWMLVTHRPASEAVAYFCQFSYLLKHGSQGARQLASAAFMPCYLAIQVLCAASVTSRGDVSAIVAHQRLSAFKAIYPPSALRNDVEQLRRARPEVVWEHGIYPLLGIPIALKMIREGVSATEVMRLSAQLPMDEALRKRQIDPVSLLGFEDLSGLFSSFFAGALFSDGRHSDFGR